jgi:hypothetical protein
MQSNGRIFYASLYSGALFLQGVCIFIAKETGAIREKSGPSIFHCASLGKRHLGRGYLKECCGISELASKYPQHRAGARIQYRQILS